MICGLGSGVVEWQQTFPPRPLSTQGPVIGPYPLYQHLVWSPESPMAPVPACRDWGCRARHRRAQQGYPWAVVSLSPRWRAGESLSGQALSASGAPDGSWDWLKNEKEPHGGCKAQSSESRRFWLPTPHSLPPVVLLSWSLSIFIRKMNPLASWSLRCFYDLKLFLWRNLTHLDSCCNTPTPPLPFPQNSLSGRTVQPNR